MRGVFGALLDEPEGLPSSEVLRRVEERVPPTAFEQADWPRHPGRRRFENLVRFATIGPVKAGWLVKNKGQWSLTDDGRAAYTALPDPEAFQRESSRLYRVWKKARAQPSEGEEATEDEELPEETAAATLEEAEESAWGEIRTYLGEMPPYDFQELVASLLKAMGYHAHRRALLPRPSGRARIGEARTSRRSVAWPSRDRGGDTDAWRSAACTRGAREPLRWRTRCRQNPSRGCEARSTGPCGSTGSHAN
jgi:hypothetical protein